jgi:hypothetical protein
MNKIIRATIKAITIPSIAAVIILLVVGEDEFQFLDILPLN